MTSSSWARGSAGSPPRSTTATATARTRSILLIDPLPDFGGHAHRNEFHVTDATTGSDVLMLRNGGAVNLDSPRTWGDPSGALLDVPPTDAALDLLDYLGVDLEAFPSTSGPGPAVELRAHRAAALPA